MKKSLIHKLIYMLAVTFLAGILLFLRAETSYAKPDISNVHNLYVRLKYNENVWEFRYPDIQYKFGIDNALEKAFEKDFRGRLKRQKGDVCCGYTLQDAENKLKSISAYIDSEPVNAQIIFNPDKRNKFTIINDVKGKKLDIDGLKELIQNNLDNGQNTDIEIKPLEINARVTAASLKKALCVRQEFSTDFSWSTPERKHNIALSLSCFNGMVMLPDETVSFNTTVGPRTEERGYKISKIISGGEFVEGRGGGVCQTSTTVYNALILADIKITEYHRHTLSVSYVPPSFDAMVNISTADLKFTNNSGNFLFFKTWTENNRAYVRIYGEKLPYTIKRKSTVLKEYEKPREEIIIDREGKYKDLYEGERRIIIFSKPKRETKGELLYYRDGKLFKTVMLRKDTYLQLVGKEIIGTTKRQ